MPVTVVPLTVLLPSPSFALECMSDGEEGDRGMLRAPNDKKDEVDDVNDDDDDDVVDDTSDREGEEEGEGEGDWDGADEGEDNMLPNVDECMLIFLEFARLCDPGVCIPLPPFPLAPPP